jgi:hypothetical protein
MVMPLHREKGYIYVIIIIIIIITIITYDKIRLRRTFLTLDTTTRLHTT